MDLCGSPLVTKNQVQLLHSVGNKEIILRTALQTVRDKRDKRDAYLTNIVSVGGPLCIFLGPCPRRDKESKGRDTVVKQSKVLFKVT